MRLAEIESVLTAPELEQNWRDTLAEWPDATPAQTNEVLEWTMALRDQFLEAAREIDDEETLEMITAIRYIEMKSHWILLNTQINYSMVSKGEADMALMYRASLVTQLLEGLERLIDQEAVERIIDFLSEPVTLAA